MLGLTSSILATESDEGLGQYRGKWEGTGRFYNGSQGLLYRAFGEMCCDLLLNLWVKFNRYTFSNKMKENRAQGNIPGVNSEVVIRELDLEVFSIYGDRKETKKYEK